MKMLRCVFLACLVGAFACFQAVFAEGYSCPTYKVYTSCNAGYYLDSGVCALCSAASNTTTTQSCTRTCTIANGTCSYSGSTQTCNGNYQTGTAGADGVSQCSGCSSWGACSGGTKSVSCDAGFRYDSNTDTCVACSGATEYQDQSGQTACKTVSPGYYKSSNTAQTQCPDGYRDGAAAANQNACIGAFTKTGSQTDPALPTGCATQTLAACTPGTCTYYKNYAGTITQDCTPTNCVKDRTGLTANANHYVIDTTSCPACNVSFTDTGTDTTSTTTCADGTTNILHASGTSQPYSRTCYHQTSSGGNITSSSCTGTQSCATKTYGTCVATSCAAGYTLDNGACVANTFNITFDGNGNSSGSAPTGPSTCTYDDTCTLGANKYGKSGYVFSGWTITSCTTASGDTCTTTPSISSVVANKASIKNITTTNGATITLSAIWTPGVWEITLNQNYTSAPTSSIIYEKYGVGFSATNYGTAITSITPPTRTGYTFRGYFASASSTSTQRITASGTLPSNTTFSTDKEVYAHWAENCPTVANGQCNLTVTDAGKVTYKITCDAGYYVTNSDQIDGTCTICPANSYCLGGTNAPKLCTSIGSGFYPSSNTGATSSESCFTTISAGVYISSARATETTPCNAGYYCPGGNVYYGSTGVHTRCSTDLGSGYTSNANASSRNDCYLPVEQGKVRSGTSGTSLSLCPAGTYIAAHDEYYGTQYSCSVCDANTYSDDGAGSCTACNTDDGYGNSGDTASAHAGVASCTTTCDAGEYVKNAGNGCVDAGTGYWATGGTVTQNATSSRTQCPAYYRTGPAVGSEQECLASCNAGYWVATPGVQCTSVGGGYWAAEHTVAYGTTDTRNLCPAGYRDGGAAANVSQCRKTVDAGNYVKTANDETATPCANWTYRGQHNVYYGSTSSCTGCPSLTSGWDKENATATGWTQYADCKEVRPATDVSNLCDGGMLRRTASSSSSWSATVETSVPFSAKPGAYVAESGQSCSQCTAGYYCSGGAQQPRICDTNTYSDDGAGSCTACNTDDGYGNSGDTASAHAGVASCTTTCDAGEYVKNAGNGCVDAGTGYWATGGTVTQNATSSRTQCPAYYRTGPAVGSEQECLASCNAGYWVATPGVQCTSVGGGYWAAEHTVAYGTTDTRNLCPAGYRDGGAAANVSQCRKTVDAGNYVKTANDETATPCANWTYRGQHNVYYGSTSSCTGCPSLTSGWDKENATATGWTQYADCKEVRPATDVSNLCDGGMLRRTASSSSSWSATVETAVPFSAKPGAYVAESEQTCRQCNAGFYCVGGASAPVACAIGSYSLTGKSECIACTNGTTTKTTGSDSCNQICPNNNDGARSWIEATWNATDNTVSNACSLYRCQPMYYKSNNSCLLCADIPGTNGLYPYSSSSGTDGDETACFARRMDYPGQYIAKNASAPTTCPKNYWYKTTNASTVVHYGSGSSCTNKCPSGYGISSTNPSDHDEQSDCIITCDGGYYIENATDSTCSAVGAGYWSAQGDVHYGDQGTRTQCASGLTTIGYGLGADESGDCGRILHAGDAKIYLRSEQKTSPSLHIKVGNQVFYGNMSSTKSGKLKIKQSGTTYTVYDDSM